MTEWSHGCARTATGDADSGPGPEGRKQPTEQTPLRGRVRRDAGAAQDREQILLVVGAIAARRLGEFQGDIMDEVRARLLAAILFLLPEKPIADAGELGETEIHIDGNDGYIYMYGPDPDRLYRVTSPILKSSKLTAHSEVTKWYGLAGKRS